MDSDKDRQHDFNDLQENHILEPIERQSLPHGIPFDITSTRLPRRFCASSYPRWITQPIGTSDSPYFIPDAEWRSNRASNLRKDRKVGQEERKAYVRASKERPFLRQQRSAGETSNFRSHTPAKGKVMMAGPIFFGRGGQHRQPSE